MLNVLVTGANRGVGLGITAAYAERGDRVFAVCRRSSVELESLGVDVLDGVDLTDAATVGRLPQRIGRSTIDVVVCNAGINTDSVGLHDIDVACLADMYNVNTLGCVRVVLALLPLLGAGSKIMLVNSMGLVPVGILGAKTTGNYGYRMSKAALISFGHALAHDLRDHGIAVALTSPGRVDTDMLRSVYNEGRTAVGALENAADVYTVGRKMRDRMEELQLSDSPALQRDAEGNPALPQAALQILRDANAIQLGQAGELAAQRIEPTHALKTEEEQR